MTAKTILIAALSGRALAGAARRAGFVPLVVDAFGDEDTRTLARAVHCLESATRTGFRQRPLLAALDTLEREATRPAIGLVLGSGFEAAPRLVAALAKRYPLLGNGADTIARSKNPATFFPMLKKLRVPYPETQLEVPQDVTGWLCKRRGGSGGAHISPCTSETRACRGRYFQRFIKGSTISVLATAEHGRVQIVGISRQWCTEAGPKPYRYGGAAGPLRLDPGVEAVMISAVEVVARALGLVGLVSFDFMLAEGLTYLLDVNPRPSATLDIFDDAAGSLIRAQIAACAGDRVELPSPPETGARAAAILYADPSPLMVEPLVWPNWVADRPRPGTRIPRARPIATVFGEGADAAGAELKCRQRLDELAHMLYGRAPDRERINAKAFRARSERFSASGQTR
ncbi:MAG: ATP-grasp domain-containing protein [Hyphomicrobium sp.]